MITLTESPATSRAAKRLHSLKTKHHVRRLARGVYEVVSGRSGATYRVDLAAMSCDCLAGRTGRMCDHKIAAHTLSLAMTEVINAQLLREAEQGITSAAPTPAPAIETGVVRTYKTRWFTETTIDGFTI